MSQQAPAFEYSEYSEELKCAVCLEPLNDAVELKPCGHLFCRSCCASQTRCPECRSSISARDEPNRIIRNMLSELRITCTRCGWKGTRQSKATHTTCAAPLNQQPLPSASSSSVTSSGGSNPPSFGRPPPPQPTPPFPPAAPYPAPQQPYVYAGYPPMMGAPPPSGPYNPQPYYYPNSACQPPIYYQQQQQPYQGYVAPPYPQQQQQPPYQPGPLNPQQQQPFQQQRPQQQPPYQPGPLNPQQQQQPFQQQRPQQAVIRSEGHRAPWVLYNFTQEDYDQLVAIFMTFDEDGSGELDRPELTKLARWLNFAQQPGDIERMFHEMDQDRSGRLSLDEFCTWASRNRPDPTTLYGLSSSEYNCVMMQFRMCDRNQDGALSLEEFQRLCHDHKYYSSPQESAAVFRRIDTDKSGSVDLNEFLMYRVREKQAQQRR